MPILDSLRDLKITTICSSSNSIRPTSQADLERAMVSSKDTSSSEVRLVSLLKAPVVLRIKIHIPVNMSRIQINILASHQWLRFRMLREDSMPHHLRDSLLMFTISKTDL